MPKSLAQMEYELEQWEQSHLALEEENEQLHARECVYQQIIDELFTLAVPGPIKNALWRKYERLKKWEQET